MLAMSIGLTHGKQSVTVAAMLMYVTLTGLPSSGKLKSFIKIQEHFYMNYLKKPTNYGFY